MASHVLVADEVWIATAELHRDYPNKQEFRQEEIVEKVLDNKLHDRLRPGVMIHISQHCVADKRPNPGNYCMLISDRPGGKGRRLWKHSDANRTARGRDGKRRPYIDDIPDIAGKPGLKSRVERLIHWWENTWSKG